MQTNQPFSDRVRRFALRKTFAASFRGVSLRVVELSERGARVIHGTPLIAGLEGSFVVPVPSSGATLSLRARAVWSRVLTDGTFETGLKIVDERPDRAADLLDHLVRLGWAGNSGPRAAKNKLREIEGDILAARQALDFLTKNRSASARWKLLVERDLTSSSGHPVDVIAAWELLGRSIDVELVARAHRESELVELDGNALLEDEVGFALVDA